MSFDAKKFLKTKFEHRTEEVPVPDLQMFFPEGAKAVWKVRGLTGQELGRAIEAADRNRNVQAIVDGITSTSGKDKAEAVKAMLGLSGDTPQDIAKRLENLILGSVDPACPLDLAIRLCEVYPVEFYLLTNKILQLTGQGQMPGKPKPSGGTAASGQASPCATSEDDSSTK